LEKLEDGPLSLKELALKLDVDENMLFYYLHGSKSLKGLVGLGLVKEGDMVELTDLGRLVVQSWKKELNLLKSRLVWNEKN